MTDLRITLRALSDDFDLKNVDFDTQNPVEDLKKRHEAIDAFIEQRSQSPSGAETTRLPRSKIVAYNLHAGRYRGLTWHDKDSEVVWLLGAKWHESGSRDDAYVLLKALDAKDLLLPTEDDYETLDRFRMSQGRLDTADIARLATDIGQSALAEAQGRPGLEVRFDLGGILTGQIVVTESSLGDGFLARRYCVEIDMPPNQQGVLPSEESWFMLVFPAFLPRNAEPSAYGWRRTASIVVVDYEDIDEEP